MVLGCLKSIFREYISVKTYWDQNEIDMAYYYCEYNKPFL